MLAVGLACAIGAGCADDHPRPDRDGPTLLVTNNDGITIAAAQAVAVDGRTLYDDSFPCAAGAVCTLVLPAAALSTPLTLRFLDQQGRMTSAYPMVRAPGTFKAVPTSPAMTGAYLISRLADDKGVKLTQLHKWIVESFDNAGAGARSFDPFEQLGGHYLRRLSETSATEAQIHDELHRSLRDGVPLPAHPPLASLPPAAPTNPVSVPDCPAAVGDFAVVMKNIGKELPVPGVGALFDIFSDMWSEGCSTTDAKLDNIQAALDRLETQMGTLNLSIEKLVALIADANAKLVLGQMRDQVADMQSTLDHYNQVTLVPSPTGGTSFRSLRSVVQASGGLTATTYVGHVATVIGAKDSLLARLSNVANPERLALLSNALDALCANPQSMPGDVISTRISCNVMINQASSFILASHTQARTLLQDVHDTLEDTRLAAITNADLKTWYDKQGFEQYDYHAGDTWKDTAGRVQGVIAENLIRVTTAFGGDASGAYSPTFGLPENTLFDLRVLGCTVLAPPRLPNAAPDTRRGIKVWMPKDPSGAYIETYCAEPQDVNAIVKSRYYYGEGDNLFGVLGVPVNLQRLLDQSKEGLWVTQAEVQSSQVSMVLPALPAGGNAPRLVLALEDRSLYTPGNWVEPSYFEALSFLNARNRISRDSWVPAGYLQFNTWLGTANDGLLARWTDDKGYSRVFSLSVFSLEDSYPRFVLILACLSRDCTLTPVGDDRLSLIFSGPPDDPTKPPATALAVTFARQSSLESGSRSTLVPVWAPKVNGTIFAPAQY